jgi:hypothetical protein
MKQTLTFFLIIFYSTFCFGQVNNLNFLKTSSRIGEPSVIESIKWIENNVKEYIAKEGISYRCCRDNYELSGGIILLEDLEYFIPCDNPFFFDYSAPQNSISFKISNLGCGGCCSPFVGQTIVEGVVTILLDNLGKIEKLKQINGHKLLDFKSWNQQKLGFIIWDNYNNCSGKRIQTIDKISFPLNINVDSTQKQIELALNFIVKKCSAQDIECIPEPACLIGNSKVSINKTTTQSISLLKKGDKVLSFDIESKMLFETEITGIDSVLHNNLIELYFANDTITCTDDHPFYIINKGWCSLLPNRTLINYSNYSNIKELVVGDLFMFNYNDQISSKKLIGYSYKKSSSEEITYTITKLNKGNTYFVNGVLTGVEELKKITDNNFIKSNNK